jgi:hypothetical protein
MENLKRELKEFNKKQKDIKRRIFKGYNSKKILKKLDNLLDPYNFSIKGTKTPYKDHNVLQIKIKADKFQYNKFSRNKVKNIGKTISKTLKSKFGVNGYITTNLDFDDGYKSGLRTQIGNNIDIFDPENYEYDEEVQDAINQQTDFKKITFYIFVHPPNANAGGKDKYNDCLYNCISYYIPKYNPFNSAEEMKRFLKIGRNEPICIDRFEEIENKIKNVGLYVSGDYTYISRLGLKLNLHLNLIDGHFTVNHRINQKVSYVSYRERTLLMQDKKTFMGYDGEREFLIDEKLLDDIYNFKTDYMLIPMSRNYKLNEDGSYKLDEAGKKIRTSIQEDYKEMIKTADELKNITNGEINMYKTGTIKRTSLQLFDKLTKHITPEHIFQIEGQWVQESTCGPIKFNTKYDGKAYKYDVKSMFPFILSSNNFMIPIKEGIFKHFTDEDFKALKFYPTGIYHVKIIKSDCDNINRLFRFNIYNKYTNISLNHAKSLGLSFELVHDEYNNALLYPRSHCLTGAEVFKTYVDYLFPIKENAKNIKGVKLLLNMISGAIGETNVKRITINDNDDTPNYYIDRNSTIVDIKPSNYDENITIYKIVNNHNYFKSQFARIKPFLWSKSRFIISEYIQPFTEKVVKCNTDSIISTEILEGIKTGHNLGDLVYEGHYEHVKIINNAKEKGEFIKAKP